MGPLTAKGGSRGDTRVRSGHFRSVRLRFLAVAYPLYFVVIASVQRFRPWSRRAKSRCSRKGFSTFGYEEIFKDARIWVGYRNTVLYTALGTFVNLLFTLPAAYVLSRRNSGRDGSSCSFFVITMFFSGGLIPTYLLMKDLHLTNNMWCSSCRSRSTCTT